ncbi:DUF6282 family protein [Nitratireductor basaltis]|uniref:Histidinol phosphatase n=1 Tax=Nitratireductor basaltis TaxID=472175 RepID=A0A084U8Q6_9HYPH|nr:DUF6282 family protein [Nitratireductor basaltis]KFB09342.1 hypothetical protein EL18_00357 [Nitratireductor basaltis]
MNFSYIHGACAALCLCVAQSAAFAQVAATNDNPVHGAIDFHVHTSPDVSSRNLTDIELARIAARYEMGGLVLKNHVTMTADRAALVNATVPEIEVFGGIVLNYAVGGLNAAAVQTMAKMSGGRGKVVWFPTSDSAFHRATKTQKTGGITVFENGELSQATEEVLAAVKEHDLVLETGHLSPEEVLAVIRRANELGIDKIVVTHAMAENPGLDIAQMKEAASLGAHLELIYLDHLGTPTAHMQWLRDRRPNSIANMAAAVKEVGAEHFILASDLGQTGNPIHPDGMVELINGLMAEGIPRSDIDMMVRENPGKLLGL